MDEQVLHALNGLMKHHEDLRSFVVAYVVAAPYLICAFVAIAFILGMAPLAGLKRHEMAPVWDHVGATLFEHGERFYNFRGLRAFKAKFHPRWEPRYLAVTGTAGAAMALMDAALLIGGGMRGVIGK